MTDVLAQVKIPYNSGLPEDVSVNTFTFSGSDALGVIIGTAEPALIDFYTDENGAGDSIGERIWEGVDRDACTITWYEITDLGTGALAPPSEVSTFTLPTVNGTTALPLEVAICGSFWSGNDGTNNDVPIRRRRGRVFLGPFQTSIMVETGGFPLVDTNFCQAILDRMEALAAVGDDEVGEWCVWSRADAATYRVNSGWVDNAFDTQRRREVPRTVRLTFPE